MMRIKQVEELTGITAKNIRFYEKEGLLQPDRDGGNGYRQYSEADVERLLQIKLLRKLGVSLAHIRMMLEGQISMKDCADMRLHEIEQEQSHLEEMRKMCQRVQKQGDILKQNGAQSLLHDMEQQERQGAKFINILYDCLTYARNILPKAEFFFEPETPVLKRQDFTDALVAYCKAEGKDLDIVHEGMEPVAYIDGIKYLFMLEHPRTLHFRGSIFFAPRTYGFKFVYAYRYQ